MVYLILAGQTSVDELVAGGFCAAAAAAWWIVTRRTSAHIFAFDRGSWVVIGRTYLRLPWATIFVALVLMRALVRPECGEVARHVYAHGRTDDPADRGRRAIGVLAGSLVPDSIILRTPMDHDEIVVHALVRVKPPTDPRWPI